jgi:hypothetical protein
MPTDDLMFDHFSQCHIDGEDDIQIETESVIEIETGIGIEIDDVTSSQTVAPG